HRMRMSYDPTCGSGGQVRQLRTVATRRTAAASGARRHRRGIDFAELSSRGAQRGGRVRNRKIQREPGVRASQRGAVAGTVREKTRRTRSGGPPDRWDSSWPASAGGGAGHRNQRRKTCFGTVARSDGKHHGGEGTAGGSGRARPRSQAALLV